MDHIAELPHDATTVPTLRLITDLNSTLNHHCPLCHFFHGADDTHCPHKPHPRPRGVSSRAPSSHASDSSFYSAHTSSSASSGPSIKAKIKPVRRPDSPTLRHKTSPERISLRDLRRQQLVQTKSSDERLRETYEAQILSYLGKEEGFLERIEE